MTNQPWMIFKPKAADVFYFWNGTRPMIVHSDLPWIDWIWGIVTSDEEQLLRSVARNKRRKQFTVPDKDLEYEIVDRGVFK